MKNLLLCFVMVFAGLLAGCSSGSSAPAKAPAPTLTSIAVTPGAPMVAAGLTQQFKATGTYSDNSTQDLTATAAWASSNTAFATITSPGGLATALTPGTTTITATVGGVVGTAILKVTPVVPTLVSITVNPPTFSLAAGLTEQFTAFGTYSDGTSGPLTATAAWASSNMTYATIAPGGLATALTPGTTTITATVSGITGSATLKVTAAVLDSIAVTPANASVPLGTLTQYTATGTYSDGSTQNLTSTVTWSSSNTTTATITSPGGLLTALTLNGTTTITATSGTVNGSTGLTVVAATLTSISISGAPTVTIANGTSYQFTAWGFYNDGSKHNITSLVTWASSNTAVATIATGPGRAQAVGKGMTTISATLGSVSGMATLVVTTATIASIVVAPSSVTIAPLTVRPFTAIGTFSDASTQNITQDVVWASSNTAFATISNAWGSIGVATAVAVGSPTISATFGGVNGSAPLNVSSATLSSIAVTPASAGLAQDSTLALQVVGTFSDGTKQHLEAVATCTSSATSVASVSGNIVTGNSNGGPVTITCSLGGVSGTASLTVEGLSATAPAITITTPASGSVAENTSVSLVATATLADGTTQNITSSVLWTSSNPTVAIMSDASGSFGQAAGVAPGTVTVIAAFAGQVGVASLTVTDATLNSITIKPANPSIKLGSSQGFSAKGTFSDGTTEDLGSQVTWSSSDITVAIIDSTGAISTTGMGTTTIEAALEGVNDTTVLTVQ
jgi:trimeric autotransporter adhesin